MRHPFSQIRLLLVFVLAGSLLSGCVASKTPATRFYILNPLDPGVRLVTEPHAKSPLAVEVSSLRLPQYLERPQIVSRSSENRLELAEYHQWGGNLRKNMIRVLAKNLSQLLATSHIAIAPHRPPAPPHFVVELEVMQFERVFEGQVRLSSQWRLSCGKDRTLLTTEITDLASPAIPPGSGVEQTVSAMSDLVGELSRIIGQEILKHARGRSCPLTG